MDDQSPQDPHTRNRSVILVEDDPAVLQSLAFALEGQGFEVHSFLSAEAMLAAGVHKNAGCLIVDQYLTGISGLELVAHLREDGLNFPTVLITTPNKGIRDRAAAAGVLFVDKPLLSDDLVNQVRAILG